MHWSASGQAASCVLFYFIILTIIGSSKVSAQGLPDLTGTTNNAMSTAVAPTAGSDTTAEPSQTAADTTAATESGATSDDDTATESLPAVTSLAGSATTGSDKPDVAKPSDLPTLSGAYSYPPPSVPPTAKAPYMQQSQLPEGTVFIAVGAGLGFFALVIIAWRGLVAWSINRSVRRSAVKGYSAVAESSYDKPDKKKAGLYSTTAPAGSSMSLEKLGSSNRPGPTGLKTPRDNSSLFFSPTAGAGMNSPGNRNSGYLPSGYYASSNAAPGGGGGATTFGSPGDRGSKTRPYSGVYTSTRTLDLSPPDSPAVRPSTAGMSARDSRSSLNLATYTNNRAPSIYLEDLMSAPPVPQHGNISDRRRRESLGRNH